MVEMKENIGTYLILFILYQFLLRFLSNFGEKLLLLQYTPLIEFPHKFQVHNPLMNAYIINFSNILFSSFVDVFSLFYYQLMKELNLSLILDYVVSWVMV